MSWPCMRTVSGVCRSCAGAGIRGCAPTRVPGIASLISEFNPYHTGTSVVFADWLLDPGLFKTLARVSVACVLFTIRLVKLRPRTQAKSCISTRIGSSSLERRLNRGYTGPMGFEGGSGHSRRLMIDSRSLNERPWSVVSTFRSGHLSWGSRLWYIAIAVPWTVRFPSGVS